MSQSNLKNPLTVMKPGRLLDVSFAYVFSDESDPVPSPHKPINGTTPLTKAHSGYGVIKTLSFIKELRDIDPLINSQSNNSSPLGQSPRKRKARGMFIDDNTSPDVINVQSRQRKVSFSLISITPLTLRAMNMRIWSLLFQNHLILIKAIKVLMFLISNNG